MENGGEESNIEQKRAREGDRAIDRVRVGWSRDTAKNHSPSIHLPPSTGSCSSFMVFDRSFPLKVRGLVRFFLLRFLFLLFRTKPFL